jgi:hypothetical protein
MVIRKMIGGLSSEIFKIGDTGSSICLTTLAQLGKAQFENNLVKQN